MWLNMNKIKIQWTAEARTRWLETASYIRQEWGIDALRKYRDSTKSWQNNLEVFPEVGSIEPLLANRSRLYRSIVICEHNKLIYYIEDKTIYIVDFWDTRREPTAQASKIK